MTYHLPLITSRQAHELIGKERFEFFQKIGFIHPALKMDDIVADLFDRVKVESAPWRFQMSHEISKSFRPMHRKINFNRLINNAKTPGKDETRKTDDQASQLQLNETLPSKTKS